MRRRVRSKEARRGVQRLVRTSKAHDAVRRNCTARHDVVRPVACDPRRSNGRDVVGRAASPRPTFLVKTKASVRSGASCSQTRWIRAEGVAKDVAPRHVQATQPLLPACLSYVEERFESPSVRPWRRKNVDELEETEANDQAETCTTWWNGWTHQTRGRGNWHVDEWKRSIGPA